MKTKMFYLFIIVLLGISFFPTTVSAETPPVHIDVCVEKTDKGFKAGFIFLAQESSWENYVHFAFIGYKNPLATTFTELDRVGINLYKIPTGFTGQWAKKQSPIEEESREVFITLLTPINSEIIGVYGIHVPSLAEVQEDWETPWEFTYSPCPHPWP
jgi:hypothetical protein